MSAGSVEQLGTTQPGGPGVAALATPRGIGGIEVWRRFRRNKLAVVGLVGLVLLLVAAIFAPLIAQHDPFAGNIDDRMLPPGGDHLLGTDRHGRDLFARVLFGARVSLRIGLLGAAMAVAIGVVLGIVAGYYSRFADAVIMRLTDVFLAFPYLVAALALVTVLGRGEKTITLVIGLLGWPSVARLLRSSVLAMRETEYLQAARAIGAGDLRIILRHVLPNTIQPVIVYAALFTGTAVIAEASLSFLGAGIQPPTPAWGAMVEEGIGFLRSKPHLLFAPAGALVMTVLSFVFVGDGLRDALDPRLR